MPNFSTLSRRQKTLNVNIPCRGSDGPLHLPVDSTGIKVEGEGEWTARKHGGSKRRVWRKIHIGPDEQRLEIRVVESTASSVADVKPEAELDALESAATTCSRSFKETSSLRYQIRRTLVNEGSAIYGYRR